MGDNHYSLAVATSTSRIHPSLIRVAPHGKQVTHTVGGATLVEGDSKRRSRRTLAQERKWKEKTKQGGEKVMSSMYRREAVHGRQPVLVASYDTHSTVGQFCSRFLRLQSPHGKRKK
ncbi:hypothetical protein PoB_005199000 [Plakobranchus ocellatus]|uniref:Uncharacterized protein n=1 Tax=Plakobranchus ocellatus TaxID=259542 RepID=A0AAV4C259_9GAST|nr:hypothetical protein PoB_005199000 [Plakobranchus ocellatus]